MEKTDPIPLRIFIVENHIDTLECFVFYLEQLGHSVLTATSMGEALEKLQESHCDVLLSDIGLPDGDGWELLRRANLPEQVFAVAMSGYGAASDRNKSLAAGFQRHEIKPITPDTIDAVIKEATANQPPPTKEL